MFTCAQCAIEACRSGKLDQMPKNCPMHDPAFFEQVLEEYFKPENHDFFVASAAVEAIGYGQWPRLREVMEFARRMGYTKLGLAFCAGLHKEAAVVDRIFRKNGFEVVSVICKTGSIPKDRAGVPQQFRVRPGAYEVMCNPIAQAELLNREGTQFNVCCAWATTPCSTNTPRPWSPPWWPRTGSPATTRSPPSTAPTGT